MTWGWGDDLHTEDLVVVQVSHGAPDADGVPAETTASRTLTGYNVQPVGTGESVGADRVVTSRWRVSGPVADWVRAHDRVVWRGETYEVDGRPQTYTGGALDHTEFIITDTEG